MPDTAVVPRTQDLAAPTDLAAYPVLRDVTPRYADLGPDGTITTMGLGRWFEDARVGVALPGFHRLVADGGFGTFRILLAAQRLQRLAPMTFDGRYRVGVGVRRIGGASYTYGYGVFRDEECIAVGDSVTVYATDAGTAELPDALRADLAKLLLDEADPAPAPRPGPERADRATYPFAVPLRARIADLDTNRHVNNVALVSWYADGVAALHDEILTSGWGGPPPGIAPSSYAVQYVAEVGYPADYELGVAVLAHDDETVRYGLGVFLGDRCVGLADATGPRGALPARTLEAWRPTG